MFIIVDKNELWWGVVGWMLSKIRVGIERFFFFRFFEIFVFYY